jgi:small-conductance mechanosensitive channel
VGVSYGDDVEQVETVLREIVKDHSLVLEDPPANVRLHRLDDSGADSRDPHLSYPSALPTRTP